MKQFFIALTAYTFFFSPAAGQARYIADVRSSGIVWTGKKVVGEHTGTIALKDGWLSWKSGSITAGEFVVDMNSIRDNDLKDDKMKETLEGHLKSDDFFGVASNPYATFKIDGRSSFTNGRGVVRGNLTIKGVTLPSEFVATVSEEGRSLKFNARIYVDRTKYNIRYGSGSFFSDLGDKAIDDVFILDVTLVVSNPGR